ncbi:prepilin-type N-terminal cleavage/methylation domain-containing protein [Planctomycetales bacterium ZRK34]|nr:prepilin-type N-terminal cleavage/methylation domain-containing protein [Planctomycetales bacterium ZRK34]
MQRRHAFTLIELLVVVAIIALLIAILLPSMSKARDTARMVACQSVQRQWATGNSMYATDQREKYVQPFEGDGAPWPDRLWMANELLRSMVGLSNDEMYFKNETTLVPKGLYCPTKLAVQPNKAANVVYGQNMQTIEKIQNVAGAYDSPVRTAIRHPSSIIQTIDTNWSLSDKSHANYAVHWDIYGESRAAGSIALGIAYRHDEGAVLQFFDVHAEYRRKAEVYPDEAAARDQLWDIYR